MSETSPRPTSQRIESSAATAKHRRLNFHLPKRSKQTEAASPESDQRGHNLRTKLGAVALLAATATAVTGYTLREAREAKLSRYNTAESTTLFDATQNSVKLAQNAILLKAGVKYRSTPFAIDASHPKLGVGNHHFIPGNVVGEVPEHMELPVAKPMIYTDKHHTTWLGFSFQDGQLVTKDVTADQVAANMVWVNASQLTERNAEIVPRKTSELIPFNVKTLLSYTQEAVLNEHGQFMSENHNPIAWAPAVQPAGSYAADHHVDMA